MDNAYFQLIDAIDALNSHLAAGTLTGEHFWTAWKREKAIRPFAERMDLARAPREIYNELRHGVIDARVGKALRDWRPTQGWPLPRVVRWLINPSTCTDQELAAFTACPMDHAAFVRDLLDDAAYGHTVRFLAAEHPQLLAFLPEEERWQRLEAVVREFGTSIDWSWPQYSRIWSTERTQTLLRTLIHDPELAGGFLTGSRAPEGWSVFWDRAAFLDVLRVAIGCAPYDACTNRLWLATALGDRTVNTRSFMDPEVVEEDEWFGWWMDPERAQRAFAPHGEAEIAQLIDASITRCFLDTDEEYRLRYSKYTQACASAMRAAFTSGSLEATRTVASLLNDVPVGAGSMELLTSFLKQLPTDKLDQAYRWALSIKGRPSRTRWYILNGTVNASIALFMPLHVEETQAVPRGWVEGVVRAFMQDAGWCFTRIQFRRNEKFPESHDRGYDAQITLQYDRETHVFTFRRHDPKYWHDSYPTRPPEHGNAPEVMVPPTITPGAAVFQSPDGSFKIFQAHNLFLLAEKWNDEYLRGASR